MSDHAASWSRAGQVLLMGMAAAFASHCFAHGKLEEASPAIDAVLDAPPAQVRLRFNEALEPAFSTMKVVMSNKTVSTARSAIDVADDRSMSLALPKLEAGSYEVQWVAVGHDGHRVTGKYGFSVK